MSRERVACASLAALVDQTAQQAQQAVTRQGCVDVVVPRQDMVDWLKLRLAQRVPCGVHVMALEPWLQGEWELWGDGREPVSGAQRGALLRPVLRELSGLEPSGSYVDSFISFVVDALACGVEPKRDDLQAALSAYGALLDEHELVELWAQVELVARAQAGRELVFVEPDESKACVRALLGALEKEATLRVVERELPCLMGEATGGAAGGAGGAGVLEADAPFAALRGTLFSGEENAAQPMGFKAVELLGTHAEPQLVLAQVREALAAGIPAHNVAVALPNTAGAYPAMLDCLAKAGVPFSCSFSLPFERTPFGTAFLQLKSMLDADAPDDWVNDAAFARSRYSGLALQDAHGFALSWRQRGGLTREERLQNLTQGIKGRVAGKKWKDKLFRLRKLLAAVTDSELVRVMLENAIAAKGVEDETLADDTAAASAALGYFDLCISLGLEPCVQDLSRQSVSLYRACGDEGAGIVLCAASELRTRPGIEYVIFARLDKDCYPMASRPSPFDAYLEECGVAVQDATAQRNRLLLLDALERSSKGFCCYRRATSALGENACQSALWDELMVPFRTAADEGRAVGELPQRLLDCSAGLRVSEADVFARTSCELAGEEPVERGAVSDAAFELLPPSLEAGETMSPTAIEDYYRCPYKWFISRRVGANTIDRRFDQMAKGNLAHAVLERFYLMLKEHGFERVTPENLAQSLQIADEAFEYQRQHEIDRHRLVLNNELEWRQSEEVRGQVRELVKRDATFLPGFVPTFLELKLEDAEGSVMSYAGVPVRGKVDRIDVDANGNAVVIDYKLSGLSAGYGFKDGLGLPTRIQTDIYAVMVERCLRAQGHNVHVIGSVYRSYAKNMLRGVYEEGIDWGPQEEAKPHCDALPGPFRLEGYRNYLDCVEEEVKDLMKKMRGGDIAPSPLCDDACTWCLAEPFCAERRG